GARSRARHARHEEADGALRQGRRDHADGCRVYSRRVGRTVRGGETDRARVREEQGRRAARRREYLRGYADEAVYRGKSLAAFSHIGGRVLTLPPIPPPARKRGPRPPRPASDRAWLTTSSRARSNVPAEGSRMRR